MASDAIIITCEHEKNFSSPHKLPGTFYCCRETGGWVWGNEDSHRCDKLTSGLDLCMCDKTTISPYGPHLPLPLSFLSSTLLSRRWRPETLTVLSKLLQQFTGSGSAATERLATLPDARPVGVLAFYTALPMLRKLLVYVVWPVPSSHISMTCLGSTSPKSYL